MSSASVGGGCPIKRAEWRHPYFFAATIVSVINVVFAMKYFAYAPSYPAMKTLWMGHKMLIGAIQFPIHAIGLNGSRYAFAPGLVQPALVSLLKMSKEKSEAPETYIKLVKKCDHMLILHIVLAAMIMVFFGTSFDDLFSVAVWSAVLIPRWITTKNGTYDQTWALNLPPVEVIKKKD
jgi:hypothetical protein